MPHPAQLPPDELLADCDTRRYRASGPGGQHRNKVETAVELTHRPTGLSAAATERRSQEQNRRVALFRLRVRLAIEHRSRELVQPEARTPSDCWRERTRGGRLAINPSHEDFPALLAEALDAAAAWQGDVPAVAKHYGVSTSQFLKLLKHEPKAMAALNQLRASNDLSPLR